jgi:hypothetical protein
MVGMTTYMDMAISTVTSVGLAVTPASTVADTDVAVMTASCFNSHGRHDGLYGHCDCHIVIVTSAVDSMSSMIAGTAMAFLVSFMGAATPMSIMTARSQHVRIKCMADTVALKVASEILF